jgi:N-acetylmuramoyl-L-alanine amidase
MKLLLFLLLAGLILAAQPTQAADAAKPLQGVVICIDPGHTSETSAGTASKDGKLTERHVNWIEALRLRTLLTQAGATVVMTKAREGEVVTNRRRAEIANAAHAVLLLRLHCDSGPQSGFATFYPDRQGTRFGVTGPSTEIIARSRQAARVFHPAAIAVLQGELSDLGIKGDSATFIGGKQGALTGSIFARVPALTVEMCVLTNTHDYVLMRTAHGQDLMAQALFAGVRAYVSALSKSSG